MALEKHLVVHLQEMYATERDYKSFLQEFSGKLHDQQLKDFVSEEIGGIDQELGNLQQCLSFFNVSPDANMKSPIVNALIQEDHITAQKMPNMTSSDADVHIAMTDIGFGQMEIGMYQGMVSMAEILNQPDVVNLLQQNLDHEQEDVRQMQELLPTLIHEAKSQQRAA